MSTLLPQDFEFVSALVRDASGIVLEPGKEYLVESRLSKVVEDRKLGSIAALCEALRTRRDPKLKQDVVEAMTTNETTFFRDFAPFDAMRKKILPELFQKKAGGKVNVWCAACSSGQEPYSLVMALLEDFAGDASRVYLVATDLDRTILERARRGIYSHLEVNRGLPAPLLLRYFEAKGLEYHLREDVRRMVDFREVNLIGTWPSMPRMDVVFLRNVLIYFDPETKRKILLRIREVLAPHGYLFLGSTETMFNMEDAFERVELGRAVAFRPKP